jgi:hypothetical protein
MEQNSWQVKEVKILQEFVLQTHEKDFTVEFSRKSPWEMKVYSDSDKKRKLPIEFEIKLELEWFELELELETLVQAGAIVEEEAATNISGEQA